MTAFPQALLCELRPLACAWTEGTASSPRGCDRQLPHGESDPEARTDVKRQTAQAASPVLCCGSNRATEGRRWRRQVLSRPPVVCTCVSMVFLSAWMFGAFMKSQVGSTLD